MKVQMLILVLSLLPVLCFGDAKWTQMQLENWLWTRGVSPHDNDNIPIESELLPAWKRDAIREYGAFISEGGWTTNELVNGFMLAVTNHLYSPSWPSKRDAVIASLAFDALSYVNQPHALVFIKQLCTNDVRTILGEGIGGVYRYSRFEPEVFDYMRTVCVKTNAYDGWAQTIAVDMETCFEHRPNYYDSSATNNFVRYQYFTLRHVTSGQACADSIIVDYLPAYSNSVQRLLALRYVANTATNAATAGWAQRQVQRLSALPTNELNNVSWLEE